MNNANGPKKTFKFKSKAVSLATKERLTSYYQGGHDEAHDDQWTNDQLAQAALYHICPPAYYLYLREGNSEGPEAEYPKGFKPVPYRTDRESRIRSLVQGAGLVLAEIDRLLRLEDQKEE